MQVTADSGLGGVEESDPQRPGTTGNSCTQTAWGQNTHQKSLLLSLPHRPHVDTCKSTTEMTEYRPRRLRAQKPSFL